MVRKSSPSRPRSEKKTKVQREQMSLFDHGENLSVDIREEEKEEAHLASSSKAEEAPPAVKVETRSLEVEIVQFPKDPPVEVTAEPAIFSVSELATQIKDQLRGHFGTFSVRGEICDFKGVHRNGHLYCGLKDENAQIRLVMWRGALQKLAFEIKQGLEVIVSGKLDFYGASGSLQISAERIEPLGIGALQLRFEQLKEKLQKEGLFDTARKRALPSVAWRLGIVTGKSTAALQDMLRILRQRFPITEVFLFPATVQGRGAPQEIVAALSRANNYSASRSLPLDVVIVGRGGGSYEDLFCFNDEDLVRALVASKIPTVSAVGHEIDFTIADFVADRRAATPSHAIQEVVPDALQWLDRLRDTEDRLRERLEDKISDLRLKLDHLYDRLIQAAPQKRLEFQREVLRGLVQRLQSRIALVLQTRRAQLATLSATLDAISPLRSFDRGWSLVSSPQGKLLQSIAGVELGDELEISLKDGNLGAKVTKKAPLKK